MRKRFILCLAFLVITFGFQLITRGENPFVDQARMQLERLGTGPNARVEVRLVDNTVLMGYLLEVNQWNFVLRRGSDSIVVDYLDIDTLSGFNLFKGVDIYLKRK